ncbi:MAG: Holliday junction resolvase RuvX [Acidobacteria bacterium]|nr:Holliday junction resolvase RuvX [Acidobacteriota bacterium]
MRFVGVDYGRKRIGLAISDATAFLARPWQVINIVEPDPTLSAAVIADVFPRLMTEDEGVDGIVVGLPRRLDGSDTDQTADARTFALQLGAITGLAVHLVDERLTSVEAEAQLATREKDWRKRKQQVDAVAAAIVLQDFLDSRVRG